MKFLITGITGFNGLHLARALHKDGHKIYGMYRDHIPSMEEMYDEITIIKADLINEDEINMVFGHIKFDGVFHLAAFTHPPSSFDTPKLAFETNALGSIHIVNAILKYQPGCVMHQCSTPEVYGICPGDRKVAENTPMRPMNPYGVAKAAGDMYVCERMRNAGLKGFITRAFSHTGPRRGEHFSISSDAAQIARIILGKQEPVIRVGNLKAQRVVMDVREVVDVYKRLMYLSIESQVTQSELFHIGGDDLYDMQFYLDKMLELFDVKAVTQVDEKLFRPIDIPVQIPDSEKVRKLLNWKPEMPIEITLTDLVNYWIQKEGNP